MNSKSKHAIKKYFFQRCVLNKINNSLFPNYKINRPFFRKILCTPPSYRVVRKTGICLLLLLVFLLAATANFIQCGNERKYSSYFITPTHALVLSYTKIT